MKKRILITLIVLAITSLLVVACQPAAGGESPSEPEAPPSEPQEEPQPTPEAPAAEPAEPMEVMLDPSMGINANAAAYVYEGLTAVDGEQTVLVLALQVTVSDDGLDYIVQLLPGITFHDGTLLNADAVVANFNRWFDPEDALRGSGTYDAWAQNFGGFKGEVDADGKPKSHYDGIEKVDEWTVLIHLNTPDEELLTKLADPAFAIISPDALAAPDFGTAAGVDGGTGPYMIGAWGESGVTLEPYADYWNPNAIPDSSMEASFE
jgi:peptide/nickel transport system substrate-binding protein